MTTDSAVERANQEATLFIRYNKAAQGGGIGSNGGVTLPSMEYKDWKLVAKKKWEDIEGTDDKEVKVFLKIGGQILTPSHSTKTTSGSVSLTDFLIRHHLPTKTSQ